MRKLLALLLLLPALALAQGLSGPYPYPSNAVSDSSLAACTNQSCINTTTEGYYATLTQTTNQITINCVVSGGVNVCTFSLPNFTSINANGAAANTTPTGAFYQYTCADSTNCLLDVDNFGAGLRIRGQRWDGTNASKSAVAAAAEGFRTGAAFYDGTSMPATEESYCTYITAQLQTATHHGAGMDCFTTPNNTTSSQRAYRLEASGGITMYSGGTAATGGDPGGGSINFAVAPQLNGAVATLGRYLGTTVLTTTGGATFTTQALTTKIRVRMCAGGGGGGGVASNAAGNGTVAGGGAAGSYAEKVFTVTGTTGYTYNLGTGGTAGISGGGTGTPGNNSTFVVGGTTVTTNGGAGGTFIGTTASAGIAVGGAASAVSTSGDLNSGGAPGQHGFLFAAGAAGLGGTGGSSQFGAGGGERKTSGAGADGIGFCSGGSGALSGSGGGAAAGGNGMPGVAVVDEFSGS